MSTDRDVRLEMTIRDDGVQIDVQVEHDDGPVAFASFPGATYRCWMARDGRAHWETTGPSGPQSVEWSKVPCSQPLRVRLHNAALAGLVAYGARG